MAPLQRQLLGASTSHGGVGRDPGRAFGRPLHILWQRFARLPSLQQAINAFLQAAVEEVRDVLLSLCLQTVDNVDNAI